MAFTRIAFPAMGWEHGSHPLERKKTSPDYAVALLEFEPGFTDPNWCRRGHAGFVLCGRFRLELESGTEVLEAGEAFVVDPDTPHRAGNGGDETLRLFVLSAPDEQRLPPFAGIRPPRAGHCRTPRPRVQSPDVAPT